MFTVANHTPAVVHVDAATLTDFEGESLSPGTDPWEIEKESRSSIARFRAATGTTLKISGGAVASSVGGVLGGAGVASGGGYFVALSGAAVGAMVAVPLFVGFTIYGNLSDKHYIEDQFRYRRLALPFTLAPGQVVHGSLFFRISPQPQRLVVRSTAEGQAPTDRIFELNPLVVSSPPAQADPRKKF